MDYTTLDSYLAPEQVTRYAGDAALLYAGYVVATDLYHLGFSTLAAAGEYCAGDETSKQWYGDKKLEHWNAATSNLQRDLTVVVLAGLGGYYAHRYLAPMAGEASTAWDNSVETLHTMNKANIPGQVEGLSQSLTQLQEAVDGATGAVSTVTESMKQVPGIVDNLQNATQTAANIAAKVDQSSWMKWL